MVKIMENNYRYTSADDSQVDEVLLGNSVYGGVVLDGWSKPDGPHRGQTGIFWEESDAPRMPARPFALVCHEDEIRRLCGRYANVRSDLSPLSAWCHLLTPRFMEPLTTLSRRADLCGMEAAWTGLTIAEAVLLAERPLANVRISACLATQSFAVARTLSLWGHISISDILDRFESANRLCRSDNGFQRGENRATKLRTSLKPLWETLKGLSEPSNAVRSRELEPLVSALRSLSNARIEKDGNEARHLVGPLLNYVPEAEEFLRLSELPPEMRLRIFDKLVNSLSANQGDSVRLRRNAIMLLAGYLATVAAGGAPSISLAEHHSGAYPEITAWAYLVGGIGETVTWTSSFDGLGRLVARELYRPFRIDEAPSCDFSYDEANVLVDPKLGDPLVNLRIKQARSVTVAIFPGVNVSIPIAETVTQQTIRADQTRRVPPSVQGTAQPDAMTVLANVLWPFFQHRIDEYLQSNAKDVYEGYPQSGRGKRKTNPQSHLPLEGAKKF